MTIYQDSKRFVGTAEDRTGSSAISGGWKELGRTTLGSAGSNIEVSSLPDKRYYQILMETHGSGGNANWLGRIGNGTVDTGSNYTRRQSQDGGSDATSTSISTFFEHFSASQLPRFGVQYIANLSGKEKLGIGHFVNANTAGAGTAPYQRMKVANKWVNTSNPMDVFRFYFASKS